ncbi:MAG: class I SAM-dependent methyltransferase [Nitrososphaerota archaeon]
MKIKFTNPISYFWLKRRQYVVKKILKKSRVLDVGCGEHKIIHEAIGLDVYYHKDLDIIGIAENMPLLSESFDSVAILEVIEHLKNPEKTLEEIHRVLKKGGQVIVSTPNVTFSWKILWWLWSHTIGRRWLNLHTNEFNEKTLVKLFSKYFKIKNIRKVNHWILILEGIKAE